MNVKLEKVALVLEAHQKLNESIFPVIEKKLNITPEMKKDANEKIKNDLKGIKTDDDAKRLLKSSIVDRKWPIELDDRVRLDIIEAMYYIYAYKRQHGSGRIISYLFAVIFGNTHIVKFMVNGKFDKNELEADMNALFKHPFLKFLLGQIKQTILSYTTGFVAYTQPNGMIVGLALAVAVLIQNIRLLFKLIVHNGKRYDLKTGSSYSKKEAKRRMTTQIPATESILTNKKTCNLLYENYIAVF